MEESEAQNRLNEVALRERFELFQKLANASCDYFGFLPLFEHIVTDTQTYSNQFIQEATLYLSYGNIFTQAPPEMKKLFIRLVLQYEKAITHFLAEFTNLQFHFSNFASLKNRSYFLYKLAIDQLLIHGMDKQQQALHKQIFQNIKKIGYFRYYSQVHISDHQQPKPNCLVFQGITTMECQFLTFYDMQSVESLVISNHCNQKYCLNIFSCISAMNLSNLKHLALESLTIGSAACKIIKTMQLNQLQELELPANQIDDQGCLWLTKKLWPRLTFLNLSSNQITNKGLEYLSKIYCPELKGLSIVFNKFSLTGMVRTHAMKISRNLEFIYYFDFEFHEGWTIIGDFSWI